MDHSGHDMGGGGMAMGSSSAMHMASATMSAAMGAMSSGAASAGAAGGHGGGHSMGGMGGNACKISMLWNWNVLDSCFLAKSWHITSRGMFAGSVLGVFFLCMAIEAWRRLAREFDRRVAAQAAVRRDKEKAGGGMRAMYVHHVVRSVLYGVQFAAAFLVMLLGMYYNGFILIAIFLGHTFGYLLFGRDTLVQEPLTESGCCC